MTTPDAIGVPLPLPAHFRRFTWIAVLVVGVAAYVTVLEVVRRTDISNLIPALLLLGSAVVPLTVLVFAASGGRRILAPTSWVVFTALAGGFIGTVSAAVLEYDALHRLGFLPMVLVGLIEESTKLVVPVVLLLAVRRVDPRAGVVIGIASGLGFAALETMGYGFGAFVKEGTLAALDKELILRAVTSPALHIAWTGLTVAALWRVPRAARKDRAVLLAVVAFVAAVLMHGAWDGIDNNLVKLALVLVGVTLLMTMISRAHGPRRRARRTRSRGGRGAASLPAPSAESPVGEPATPALSVPLTSGSGA